MTEETAFYAPDGRGTHLEELRQRREKYGRDLAARKESERLANARAELEAEKGYRCQQYMEAGIDPADFDRDHWPGILRDMMQRRVASREDRADTSLFG